jgi:hypothetical protein
MRAAAFPSERLDSLVLLGDAVRRGVGWPTYVRTERLPEKISLPARCQAEPETGRLRATYDSRPTAASSCLALPVEQIREATR